MPEKQLQVPRPDTFIDQPHQPGQGKQTIDPPVAGGRYGCGNRGSTGGMGTVGHDD